MQKAYKICQQNKHPERYTALENVAEIYLKKSTQTAKGKDAQQSQQYKEQTLGY